MNYYKPVFKLFGRPFKQFKLFLKQRAGWLDIPRIIVFRGFGNDREFIVQGRVIEDSGLAKPEQNQGTWSNILSAVKRFASDEIAGVRVKATFDGLDKLDETDEYGFFRFVYRTPDEYRTISDSIWISVNFELIDKVVENQPLITGTGLVNIIPSSQTRIIVSDIDDTVLVSHSTKTLRKLRLMLFKNARTRKPVRDVAAFYRGLEKGSTGKGNYPFFYVSSSEWNLYDLLDDFFEYNDIPRGVFLLRKLNHSILKFWRSGGGNHQHKYQKLKHLINFYPDKTFILIGDSGQQDPFIYRRLAMEFPGRIEAVFIRKVKPGWNGELSTIKEEIRDTGTIFEEMDSYEEAREKAAGKYFIMGG